MAYPAHQEERVKRATVLFVAIEGHFADCRRCWPLREPLLQAVESRDFAAIEDLERQPCEELRGFFALLSVEAEAAAAEEARLETRHEAGGDA